MKAESKPKFHQEMLRSGLLLLKDWVIFLSLGGSQALRKVTDKLFLTNHALTTRKEQFGNVLDNALRIRQFRCSPRAGQCESFHLSKCFLRVVLVLAASISAFGEVDLNTMSTNEGFRIKGASPGLCTGRSVRNAGDVNGDGYSDIIVGSDTTGISIVYVIFGRDVSTFADIQLPTSAMNAGVGFRILAPSSDIGFGYSVSSAGDVNGDGKSDVIIGAPFADPVGGSNAGISYVVFGKTIGIGDVQLTNAILNVDVGFRILGAVASDNSGISVSNAGDINNDGIGDLIVGARYGDLPSSANAGIAYVIFGRRLATAGVPAFGDIQLTTGTTAMPSTVGFRIIGSNDNLNCGHSVSSAGDVNNDNIADLIVAERLNAYVIFGRSQATQGSSPFVDYTLPTNAMPATIGFRILGLETSEGNGRTVGAAGDVNGDGIDDVIIGGPGLDPPGGADAGITFVVFGKASGIGDVQLPTTVMDAAVGFRILGAEAGDVSGHSVSGAGDVNYDGVADIIIGAHAVGGGDTGRAYVVYGRNIAAGATAFGDIQLPVPPISMPAHIGFFITGAAPGDYSGHSVSAAGDINNDGIDDIIVGANNVDTAVGGNVGTAYVIFGVDLPPTAAPSLQPSRQPSLQPSLPPSFNPSLQPSRQPSLQPSLQPTAEPSRQPSLQPSLQPTVQPSIQPSLNPTTQPTARPTSQPSSQPSRQPSGQPTQLPTGQPSEQPSRQPSTKPSHQPSSQPTHQPTIIPSIQPSSCPSGQPSNMPSGQPSFQPSSQPSCQPSRQPNSLPSGQPSRQPTVQPSSEPSCQPTSQPSREPSVPPSSQPSHKPTGQPSIQPNSLPSGQPSEEPSKQPSSQPSVQPSTPPSAQPSTDPSSQPSGYPSTQPSFQPSNQPSCKPTGHPSSQPFGEPSSQPSCSPTKQPSSWPSCQPSYQPSWQPSTQPIGQPSNQPNTQPSFQPSSLPSTQPSSKPSTQNFFPPSSRPSGQPSGQPSIQPSTRPSTQPTSQPIFEPTQQPSGQPSNRPSMQPFAAPTIQPTLQPTVSPTEDPHIGSWVATQHSFNNDHIISIVDNRVWMCGNVSGASSCVVLDSAAGLQGATYNFPWKETIAIYQPGETRDRIVAFGRTVIPPSAVSSSIATCATDTLLFTAKTFSDTDFIAATYVSIAKKMVYVGAYTTILLACVLDTFGQGDTYIYDFQSMGRVSLTHVQSPPSYVGAFSAGTAVSINGRFNHIVAGVVRTDSGAMSAMYLSPASGSILNSAELVNAMALEYEHPDTFIAGGLQLSDGVGMHAYLLRVNAFFGSIKYTVRYRAVNRDNGESNESSSRRSLKENNLLFSAAKGLVRVSGALYVIINVIGRQNNSNSCASLSVLQTDMVTGSILQQVHVSSPTACLSCSRISASSDELFLYVSCTLRHNTSRTEAIVLATELSLGFDRLPAHFARSDEELFEQDHIPFRRYSLPVTSKRTDLISSDYAFSTAEGTPTLGPALAPILEPSKLPSAVPSVQPSSSPTSAPSISQLPTSHPSSSGPTNTYKPSLEPSLQPSLAPSARPTSVPSAKPTPKPTARPSVALSRVPSIPPSPTSTVDPTYMPTAKPTRKPSLFPSIEPANTPSASPSSADVVSSSALKSGQKADDAVMIFVYILAGVTCIWCMYQLISCCIRNQQSWKRKQQLQMELHYNRLSIRDEPSRKQEQYLAGKKQILEHANHLRGAYATSRPNVPDVVGSDASSSVAVSSLRSSEISALSCSVYSDEPSFGEFSSQTEFTRSRESIMEEGGERYDGDSDSGNSGSSSGNSNEELDQETGGDEGESDSCNDEDTEKSIEMDGEESFIKIASNAPYSNSELSSLNSGTVHMGSEDVDSDKSYHSQSSAADLVVY